MKRAILAVLLLCGLAAGQAITANSIVTNTLTIQPSGAPPAVTITLMQSQPGTATYYYWVVSTNSVGSIMSGPFSIANAPVTLSPSANVTASWVPSAGTSYSLLRTATTATPGACNCAVVVSSNASLITDDSNSLLSYAVPALLTPVTYATGSPNITNLSIAGTLMADQFGASGSAQSVPGTCTAGSNIVPVSGAADFRNAQGVALYGCGSAAFGGASVVSPSPTVINWCGQNGLMACGSAPGSTSYSYKIVVEDGGGGYSAPGAIATTTTGAATLGISCCNSVAGANYLSWDAPSGITTNSYGYVVYAEASGVWRIIGLSGIPGYALPWLPSHSYPVGSYVVPATSPNGSYYVATTGGTSGSSQPVFCASASTCTVTDGGVTWQRQPFTWMDTGQTAVAPAWIPTSPPAGGAADRLVTTIASGAGTTTMILNQVPQTSAVTTIYHDDTSALQAAVNSQISACTISQPAGNAPAGTCPAVFLPFGTYRVTSPVALGTYAVLRGSGALYGDEPFAPILSEARVQKASIQGLHFIGGRDAVYVASATADASTLDIVGIDARDSTDYALSVGTLEGDFCGGLNCVGLATNISGQFYGDRMLAYNGGDWMSIEPNTWVEPLTAAQPYEGQIGEAAATSLGMHGMIGVPDATPYSRWVDDWNAASVVIDNNSRLGGEDGGISAVYFLGGFGAAQAFNWGHATVGIGTAFGYQGSSFIVRDSMVVHGDVGLMVTLNNSFPQRFISTDTYWGLNATPVMTCSGVNESGVIANQPCALPAGFTATNLDTVLEGALSSVFTSKWSFMSSTNLGLSCRQLQPALLPLMQESACSNAPNIPTAGIWQAPGTNGTSLNQIAVWNSTPTSGGTLAWILPTNGVGGKAQRAAPAWQASHTYTLATSPFGEGSDFISSGGQTFYISAVSSGSTCTSGASIPTFNGAVNSSTGTGGTTTDGTCTWTAEAVGTPQNGSFGYVAPFSAVSSAAFLPVGAVGTVGTGVAVLAGAMPLTGSVAGATTSLPANSCGDAVTGTVAGATTTMTVTATGQGALPSSGLSIQAAVTSANTVTVQYCNNTTSAIVPAAISISLRVIQ